MRPRKTNRHLPKRVYQRRGKYYYVFQGKWYSLGGDLENVIERVAQVENELLCSGPIAAAGLLTQKSRERLIRTRTRNEIAEREQLMKHLRLSLNSCKVRAKRASIPFDLSMRDIEALLDLSKSRCAVTEHEFSFVRYGNTLKRPFVPSIDRIDSTRGYTPDNCRIVCSITNIAMNAWGDAPLKSLISGR